MADRTVGTGILGGIGEGLKSGLAQYQKSQEIFKTRALEKALRGQELSDAEKRMLGIMTPEAAERATYVSEPAKLERQYGLDSRRLDILENQADAVAQRAKDDKTREKITGLKALIDIGKEPKFADDATLASLGYSPADITNARLTGNIPVVGYNLNEKAKDAFTQLEKLVGVKRTKVEKPIFTTEVAKLKPAVASYSIEPSVSKQLTNKDIQNLLDVYIGKKTPESLRKIFIKHYPNEDIRMYNFGD